MADKLKVNDGHRDRSVLCARDAGASKLDAVRPRPDPNLCMGDVRTSIFAPVALFTGVPLMIIFVVLIVIAMMRLVISMVIIPVVIISILCGRSASGCQGNRRDKSHTQGNCYCQSLEFVHPFSSQHLHETSASLSCFYISVHTGTGSVCA
jgi:hypothetical protein